MDISAPGELLDGEEEPVVLGLAEACSEELSEACSYLGDIPISEIVSEHHDSESISPSMSAQSFVDPQGFTKYYFNQTLCSNQVDIVGALTSDARTSITVEPRQVGKTSSVAVACSMLCETEGTEWNKRNAEPYRIGIFAPKAAQAQLDTDRIKSWARYTRQGRALINWEESTNDRIVWHNGSEIRIYSASEQAENDGKTLNRIILEEAQKISDIVVSQSILPMGGACVCAGTLVTGKDGRRVFIENFFGEKIVGYKNGSHFLDDVVWKDRTGMKECFRLVTHSGRILECSYDHPVMIKLRATCPRRTEYVETEDLSVGMQVAILDELPIFGKKRMFEPRLIGMLIGDGSYGLHHAKRIRKKRPEPGLLIYARKNGVKYCSCDPELQEYAKKFGFKFDLGHKTRDGKSYEEYRVSNKFGLIDRLEELGIYGQVKENKVLPDDIDSYSLEDVRELLGGLFDTDGCVMIEEGRRGTVSFSTIGEKLVWGVFGLLDKMGIHGVVRRRSARVKEFGNGLCFCREYFELNIREKASIVKFHKNVKLLCGYKQERLDCLAAILSCHKEKRQKGMLGLYFERLVKIERIGMKPVYNLTAKFEHNYVANGIITHNTAACIAKIGTVRPIRNHFFNSWHNDARALKTWHHWLICDNLLRGGFREYGGRKISQYVLDMMPLAEKEKYIRAGIFPQNPDFYFPGQQEVNDFLTQYELRWLEQFGLFLDSREKAILFSGFTPFQYSQGSMGEEIYAGVDFATGVGADETAVAVWRRRGAVLTKIWGCTWSDMPAPDQRRELLNLFCKSGPFYGVRLGLGDFGGNGAAIIPDLAEAGLPFQAVNFGSNDKNIVGASMNMKTSMFLDFKRQLQMGWLRYPVMDSSTPIELQMDYQKGVRQWTALEQEIIGFGINRRIQAPDSDHDDICCCDVLAVRAAKMGPQPIGGRRSMTGPMPYFIMRSNYR